MYCEKEAEKALRPFSSSERRVERVWANAVHTRINLHTLLMFLWKMLCDVFGFLFPIFSTVSCGGI